MRQALAQDQDLAQAGGRQIRGNPEMQHPIIVTGTPGAGKTTLVGNLARHLEAVAMVSPDGPEVSRAIDEAILTGQGVDLASAMQVPADHCVIEHCAYGPGWIGVAGTLVTVVDAVSVTAKNATLPEAVMQAVCLADLVVLTRTDLVEEAPVRDQISRVTDVPIHAALFGKLDPEVLPAANPREISLSPRPATVVWSYTGGANLDTTLAEKLLKRRPSGTTRIKGHVIAGEAGLRLDQTGRARSVTPCKPPQESQLFAAGPKDTFREQEMSLHFAETVTSGAATSGWFGFR